MTTIILAAVCIILIFVLYVVSGGWKKYGGLSGIFQWIRATSGGTKNLSAPGAVSSRKASASDEEVVKVLREVYEDFDARYSELAARVKILEQRLDEKTDTQSLKNVLDQLKLGEIDMPQEGVSCREEPSGKNAIDTQDDTYFRILDMLEAGKSEEEIAALLAVDRDEISYVRRIMSGPLSH